MCSDRREESKTERSASRSFVFSRTPTYDTQASFSMFREQQGCTANFFLGNRVKISIVQLADNILTKSRYST